MVITIACSITILAGPAHFDDGAQRRKARRARRRADGCGNTVVVDMGHLPAIVADQEYAVMHAPRVAVGDKGVGALDTADQIFGDE